MSDEPTIIVSKCCLAPIVDAPLEGGGVEMLCSACGAVCGVRLDHGTLDLGVIRAEVEPLAIDYEMVEDGPWTAGPFVRLDGGTLDLGVVRDRAASWPNYRWWKRLLPRRWWPRLGYVPVDVTPWRETFEEGSL